MPPGLKEVARLLPPGLANDIANLYYEFLELRPQVVHTWLDWDNVRGGLAAALAGVPRIVVSGRNINPSNFALYQPYMDPAYRVLAKLPNVMLINNSRAGANDYADWIGIQRDQIGVMYNAVDFGGRMRLPPRGARPFAHPWASPKRLPGRRSVPPRSGEASAAMGRNGRAARPAGPGHALRHVRAGEHARGGAAGSEA